MHVNGLLSSLILIFFTFGNAFGKNILIINPMFGYSHVKFISQMANVIADHGHNVTLFQPYHVAMKNTEGLIKNKNIEVWNYYPDHYDELLKTETPTFPIFWDSQLMNQPILMAFMMPKILGKEFEKTSEQLLKDKKLHNELKARKFDVAMIETFEITGFCKFLILFFLNLHTFADIANLIGLPFIPIMSAVRLPMINEIFGQPSGLGYIPQVGSKRAPEAGFLDRLNDVYRSFFESIAMKGMTEHQNNFIERTLGHPVPHWKDLLKESPVYITNSNPYLDFVVPTTATIVHAGGITIDLKKLKNVGTLPDEYEKILQERDSTVLISFGSVIRSFEMPENFKAGIIKMFKSMPDVTFIWKYEKDDEEFQKKLPKNVHLKKWVPQPALLSDDRLKVFVTHGGLGSTMEIAYTGKPALMVPIFGDQPQNAYMLERHGGAVAYNKFDLQDGDKLTKIMKDMVSNPKYNKNAKALLNVLRNQPIDPKYNFIKHLEFAIEFPNLRSQVPAINHADLIAHYYLDAIAFLVISGMVSVYLMLKVLQRILIRFIVKKQKND
ncbi:hypothetical protein CAEBREN_26334 [Caenorhabditis brenneri]|uniref:glucuronosyltransferase n=1 Tax=Caenorhabditis brenneri TaxID=135651 RepID=G0MTR8_CAEBE|nr:hypothetical protein CAEBREN_26334 [Caenorhabditis brenneri]